MSLQPSEINENHKRKRCCQCSCHCHVSHDQQSREIKKWRRSNDHEGSLMGQTSSSSEVVEIISRLKFCVVKWSDFFGGLKNYRDKLLTLIKKGHLVPKTVTEGFARKLFLIYPGFANHLTLLASKMELKKNDGKLDESLLTFFKDKGLSTICARYSQQADEVLAILDGIEGKRCHLDSNESANWPAVDFEKLQGRVNAKELGLGSLYLQPAKCFQEIISLMDDLIRISANERVAPGLASLGKAKKKALEFDMLGTKFQQRLQ